MPAAPTIAAECYRTDPAALVAALTDGPMLARYQETIADELRSLADRQLVNHLKRMSTAASRAQASGFDQLARADLGSADSLLSEILAIALWHRWDLPLEALGQRDLTLDGLRRGLLGADHSIETASVWQLDGTTIAVARTRVSGDTDLEHHKTMPGHACDKTDG